MKKLYYYDTFVGDIAKNTDIIKDLEISKYKGRYSTYEAKYDEENHLLTLGSRVVYHLDNCEKTFEDEHLLIYYDTKVNNSMIFFKPKNFDDSFYLVKIKATPNITAFLIQKGEYSIIKTTTNLYAMKEDEFEIISEEKHTKDICYCCGMSSIGYKFDDRVLVYNLYEKAFYIYNIRDLTIRYPTSTLSKNPKVGDTVYDRLENKICILLSDAGEVYSPISCSTHTQKPYNLIKIDSLKYVNTKSVVIMDGKHYIAEYDIKQRKILVNGNYYDTWYALRMYCVMHITDDVYTDNPSLCYNGRTIHLSKDCVICPECGETMKPEELKTHKCKIYCNKCGKELTTPEEIKFKRCKNCQEDYVNTYNGHWAKKDPIFEKPDKRDKLLHFGIELELDQDDDDGNMFENCLKDLSKVMNSDIFDPMCYFEEDGSLSDYGIETVWNPKTIDWFRNNKNYITKILDTIGDNGYTSEANGRCGLHIHIDRKYLGKRDKYISAKIVYFVNKFLDDYFLPLSRRKNLEYCTKIDIKQDDDYNTINSKIKDKNRYVTVNCENKDTIEFRLWRGTINPKTFLATVELTNAIVEFCKHISLNKLQRCTFDDFVATLDEDTKKYVERRLGR